MLYSFFPSFIPSSSSSYSTSSPKFRALQDFSPRPPSVTDIEPSHSNSAVTISRSLSDVNTLRLQPRKQCRHSFVYCSYRHSYVDSYSLERKHVKMNANVIRMLP